jgi:hypothetical protein
MIASSAVVTNASARNRTTQVNIRLDASDADVLAALAFLSDASAAEVVRPVIARFLDEQRKDPDVQTAIMARRRRHQAPQN